MTVALQDHHLISIDIAGRSDIIKTLSNVDLFNFNASSNRIYLPSSASLASALGISYHSGAPLASYESGVERFLSSLQANNPSMWAAAKSEQFQIDARTLLPANASNLNFFRDQVNAFTNVLAWGFREGKIFTNAGNQSQAAVDAQNSAFFAPGNLQSLLANNATVTAVAQIGALRSSLLVTKGNSLGGNAAKFSSLGTWSQIQDVLQYTRANNVNLVAKTPLDFAITNDGLPTGPAELVRYMQAAGIVGPPDSDPSGSDPSGTAGALRIEEADLAEMDTGPGLGGRIVGSVGSILVTPDGLSSYLGVRINGETVLSTDLAASEKVAVAGVLAAGMFGPGGSVSVLGAASTLAVYSLAGTVASSAWRYLAAPIDKLGTLLSPGDRSDAISETGGVMSAVANWVQNIVVPYASRLQDDPISFAANPAGYVASLSTAIWNATQGALFTSINSAGAFLGSDISSLQQLLSNAITGVLGQDAGTIVASFGGSSTTINGNIANLRAVIAQQPAQIDPVVSILNGNVTVISHAPGATVTGQQLTVSTGSGLGTVTAAPFNPSVNAVSNVRAAQQNAASLLSNLNQLSTQIDPSNASGIVTAEDKLLVKAIELAGSPIGLALTTADLRNFLAGNSVTIAIGSVNFIAEAQNFAVTQGKIIGLFKIIDAQGNIVYSRPNTTVMTDVVNNGNQNRLTFNPAADGTAALAVNVYLQDGEPAVVTESGGRGIELSNPYAGAAWGSVAGAIDGAGDIVTIASDGSSTITSSLGQAVASYTAGSLITVVPSTSDTGADISVLVASGDAGGLEAVYHLEAGKTVIGEGWRFENSIIHPVDSVVQYLTAVNSLITIVNGDVGLDTPTGTLDNSRLGVSVIKNNTFNEPEGTDWNGPVPNDIVWSRGGATIWLPGVNNDGLIPSSIGDITTGEYRPGNQMLQPTSSDLVQRITGIGSSALGSLAANVSYLYADLATGSTSFLNIDPLVLALDGNGISLSNWINNSVYLRSSVGTNGQSDGKFHHNSWVNPSDGILAIDFAGTVGILPGTDGITNITETLSENFRGGPTPGKYTDGLAALVSLAQPGAVSFSVATALTDPNTHISYFSEVQVWQDVNQDGISQPGELHSLSSLDITSISLAGSRNQGETLAGNRITNRTFFTTSDGATGAVAAVTLQTDTTGDVSFASGGGMVITSTPEGGAAASTTFVAQNGTSHSYTISGGTLRDATSGSVITTNNIRAVFSSTQGDTITVGTLDTGTYWLGGGTGADTLNGGAGTNVLLMNANTVVRGGSGFNIANVIDANPANIDLKTSNLQEVIGGAGGGVFNASGATWNVFIQGGVGNNIIIGGAANSALNGGSGDDLIEAGPGGSVIHAGSGNDVIYGGSGNADTAFPNDVNAGLISNLSFIERLYLGGLTNSSVARESDTGGLRAWLNYINSGHTPQQVAQGFLGSTEGISLYGRLTDAQFVNQIYLNMLGRLPSTTQLNNEYSNAIQYLASNPSTGRGDLLYALATTADGLSYWGAKHPGASDVIHGGPGHDTVVLGTNNSEIYVGAGAMTVIGKAGSFSVVGFHGSYTDYKLTLNSDGTISVTDNIPGRDGLVIMSNISALNFADIGQVMIAGARGMPVNDTINAGDPAVAVPFTLNGKAGYKIYASTVLANDQDFSGRQLMIRDLLDNNGNPIAMNTNPAPVNGGVVILGADAIGTYVWFAPTAGFPGIPSFRYHVQDDAQMPGANVFVPGTTTKAELTGTVSVLPPGAPNDPQFPREWFLQAIDSIPILAQYTGKGVSVGIFDTSGNVDFSNPDLIANAGASLRIDGTPGTEQIGTHATMVAGVIGAALNGVGIVGVAPRVTISSVAIGAPTSNTGDNGNTPSNAQNLLGWLNYDVANNSFALGPAFAGLGGSSAGIYAILNAMYSAVTTGRGGLGTIVVFSAGNGRAAGQTTNDTLVTEFPYEITVGAVYAATDVGSLQISEKPFSSPGASILVSAPADHILSTGVTFANEYGQQFGADYETAQGTSYAAPIVSGVVALMLQANPKLTYRDVQQILAYTAIKVDTTDTDPFTMSSPPGSGWFYNGATNWNGGSLHDSSDYGYGEVDARAAVRLAETWNPMPALPDVSLTGKRSNVVLSAGTFSDTAGHATLSLHNANGQSDPTSVESVLVTVALMNVVRENLTITLTSPSGTKSVLMNRPGSQMPGGASADPADFALQSSFVYAFETQQSRGENYVGNWTLSISDASGANSLTVVSSWNLDVFGSNPGVGRLGQTYIYTDEFGSLTDDPKNVARGTLVGTGNGDTLNAAAVSSGSTLDLTPGSTNSVIAGRSVTIDPTTHITTAIGGDGNDTLIAPSGSTVTLQGGRGNDTYIGSGNDIYILNNGFGRNVIVNGSTSNAGPSGQLVFGSGLDLSNLWFTRSGDNLVVQQSGTTSVVTLNSWWASPTAPLQSIALASGLTLGTAQIANLAVAEAAVGGAAPVGAAIQVAPAGGNLTGGTGPAVLVAVGNGGTIVGGTGPNTIILSGTGNVAASMAGVTSVNILGSQAVVQVDANATVAESGTSSVVWVGSNVTATLAGSSNALNGTDAQLQSGGTVTLGGTNNVVNRLNNTTITVTGAGNNGVLGAGNTLNFTPASSGGSFVVGYDVTAAMAGSGNVLWGSTLQSGGTVTLGGDHNSFNFLNNGTVVENGTNAVVWVGGSVTATVAGSNNALNGTATENGGTVTLGGTNNAVNLLNNATVIENGTADVALVGGSINATVAGSGNSLYGTSLQSGGTVTLGGTSNFVAYLNNATVFENGTNDVAWVGGSVTATVAGSGNALNGTPLESGGTVTLAGANDSVNLLNNATITVTGSGNSGVLGAGNTLTVALGATGNNFIAGANSNVVVAGDANAVTVGDGSSIILGSSGTTYITTNGSISASISSSGTAYIGGGAMSVAQAISGPETFILDGASNLTLSHLTTSSSVTMKFLKSGEAIQIQDTGTSSMQSSINGFIKGDTIDLSGLYFGGQASFTYTNPGHLTVSDGTNAVGINFSGTFTAASFSLVDDGHHGIALLHA